MLQILRLNGLNKVKSLPEEIGELSSLKELWIEKCGIQSIPKSIGRLKQLEKMTCRHCNALQSIPEEMGELSSLKELLIDHCSKEMSNLPNTLGKQLEKLTLVDLKISSVNFSQLSCLKELVVHKCPVSDFYGLAELKRLEKVDFSELRMLRSALFGEIPSLKELHISDCGFTVLGGGMQQLEKLTLRRLKNLVRVSEDFGNLPNLKVMLVEKCSVLKLISAWGLMQLEKMSLTDAFWFPNFPDGLSQFESA